MNRMVLLSAAVAVLGAGAMAQAQQAQQAPPTYETMIVRSWKAAHDKILAMAKDTQFPEDKLNYRPHPDARSVLEELRHVTIGLEMSTAQIKGEKFDYMARNAADQTKPATRASVVAEMEAAIAASYPVVEQSPRPNLIFWIEHQGEHYGKLVSHYRANGIVPPASRR